MGNKKTNRTRINKAACVRSIAIFFGLGLTIGCTSRPVTNTTAGEHIIRAEETSSSEVKPVKKDVKTGPKTWENSGSRIAKNVEKPLTVKSKPAPVIAKKKVKDRSWETGGADDFKDVDGALALGKSDSSRAKHPSMKSSAVPGSPAALGMGSAGISADSEAGPRPLPREMKERRPSPFKSEKKQMQESGNLLTAGSFDDADDIQVFQSFWDKSELASASQLSSMRVSNWAKEYKKADTRKHGTLQLAFVIDTTGSMGDELEYLKVEFKSIVSEINRSYPGVKKEFAVIAYRDQSDEYVTRGLNFTDNVDEVQNFIRNQSAGGGGDYPEAVHTALEESHSRLNWKSNSDTARMLFHIADAPAHMEEMDSTFKAVEKLGDAGVNVFPVAASGVMDVAEAMMRATALLTGGKYIFLTDDSGIGNAHAAPKHPCYDVEKLKNIMVRVINDRISGTRSFPVARNIIRHGGDRTAGYCRTNKQVVGQW